MTTQTQPTAGGGQMFILDALHQMIADLVGQAAESEGEMTMAKLEATYRRDRLRQHLPA